MTSVGTYIDNYLLKIYLPTLYVKYFKYGVTLNICICMENKWIIKFLLKIYCELFIC